MARFTIGSSLKMYFSHRRTLEWVQEVAKICADHPATVGGAVQFFVIPTFPSIPGVVELARPAGIAVGGQDLHWEDSGPFTGEYAAVFWYGASGVAWAAAGSRLRAKSMTLEVADAMFRL